MEPIELVYDICRCYLKDQVDDVNPALCSKIEGFLRSRNLAGLASCSCHFDNASHSVKEFRFLRQVEAFFKKNVLFADKGRCKKAAEDSFFESEELCSRTNLRLRDMVLKPHLIDERFRSHILRMRRYISNVLGPIQPFLDNLHHLVRVTPGATANAKRSNSLPQLKMRLRVFATRRSSKYIRYLYHLHGFENVRIKATHSNRVELVPKNWKTDRTIACEPEGNLPLQLAFDNYAKRRLRRVGIDLSDQTANQKLAKQASIDDAYATVDFSRASDTISYNTIALLFPEEWFAYLTDVRSPGFRGVFGDGVYSKFSSMGNGSTFTIETLVFAAACYALSSSRDFLVYGDDVIIRSELYEDYVALTSFLGFTVNREKSFASGPFRESCGGDYFSGVEVTPVYIRNIGPQKAVLCHLVNTIRSICLPGSSLESLLRCIIAEHKLFRVPFNEDTMSGVWMDPDKARSKKIMVRKHGVDKFKAYIAKSKQRTFVDSRGYYLWFLMKNSQVLFSGPWALARNVRPTVTSSVPIFDHVYVRKWVCWVKPAGGMTDYLYWWSEQ